MLNFGPLVPSTGPQPASIFILAEAPGTEESDNLRPLLGQAGRELRRMLHTIGVNLDDCYKSNVFSRQPAHNNLALFTTPNPSANSRNLGPLCHNPTLFIDDQWLPELDRLRGELAAVNPKVVVALGNVACWALLGQQGINGLRGTVYNSPFLGTRPLKVIPTYHPALVLRQWSQRAIAIADLEKARAESFTPTITYDNTELWIAPTLDDLALFGRLHLESATEVATDVETKRGQITCVSFAPTPAVSICVPFWNDGQTPNAWPDLQSEVAAWKWVKHWIEKPTLVKVLQNGLFDSQYFITHGMTPRNFREDTMLAHHSLYCELQKGLGFLGSLYCRIPTWKKMRTYKAEDVNKKDD